MVGRSRPVSRAQVLATACDLFAAWGYRATSMKDIAQALSMRAPSLYNHVASKQDILVAIMNVAMDRALAALDEALEGVSDVSDQLRRATESLVLDFLRNPAEVTVTNNEVRNLDPANRAAIVAKRDVYAARVRAIIEDGCQAGRFDTTSPRLAAFAVLEMGNGAKSWFRPDGRYSDTSVARQYGESRCASSVTSVRPAGASRGTRLLRRRRRHPVHRRRGGASGDARPRLPVERGGAARPVPAAHDRRWPDIPHAPRHEHLGGLRPQPDDARAHRARPAAAVLRTVHPRPRAAGQAHIERRFSMPWSSPVARMRGFVQALRAIWTAWETGAPLRFEGEFYRHTLMAPNFDPGPTGYGVPPIYLAGVGPQMTAAASEVADGLLCHPLATPRYLTEVTIPAVTRARARRAESQAFCVTVSVLAATGPDDAALAASVANVRRKMAFYAATPAYRPILDVHGLGHVQPVLNETGPAGPLGGDEQVHQ